jgi:3,4-dihydroxy 2-butanone 4-phosphate synthase/GTP cyclohydrolase II
VAERPAPIRDGGFQALGHVQAGDDGAIVALIHGAVAIRDCPLVHVHAACVLGDVVRSRACGCHADLEAAVAAMVREGAGAVLYAKPALSSGVMCGRDRPVDAAVAAGLLRGAGVTSLRLVHHADALAQELRAFGLDVVAAKLPG